MPVVIEADAWDRWLDPSPRDPGELLGLLVPNEDVELEVYAVERFVNDVRRDGPELIAPLVPAARRCQALPASVHPSDAIELRKAVARLGPLVDRGGERARRGPRMRRPDRTSATSKTTTSPGRPSGTVWPARHDEDHPRLAPARRVGDDRDRLGSAGSARTTTAKSVR